MYIDIYIFCYNFNIILSIIVIFDLNFLEIFSLPFALFTIFLDESRTLHWLSVRVIKAL
jgi:hypothetical protein